MKIRKEIQVTQKVIVKQVCNLCGETNESSMYWQGGRYINDFSVYPTYGSKWDGAIIEFDLCDECLTNIFNSMKIRPTGLD